MEGMEDFRRITEDTGRLSRLEPIHRVMSEASEYYGDAILKGVGDMARDAREDPESAMCLGRMLVVGEESDRDILAAADLFEKADESRCAAMDWLMFLEGQHPEWDAANHDDARGPSYGLESFEMPDPEWSVLLDLCAIPMGKTYYSRFRNSKEGFENRTFQTGCRCDFDEYPLSEKKTVEKRCITFVFKPTGFVHSTRFIVEKDGLSFPTRGHYANQGISSLDAAHMLRLCIDSAMESIRGGCE